MFFWDKSWIIAETESCFSSKIGVKTSFYSFNIDSEMKNAHLVKSNFWKIVFQFLTWRLKITAMSLFKNHCWNEKLCWISDIDTKTKSNFCD